ncbi:Fc.00g047540.m01.CDS01 [Cosmosporella sp. VM-42]
MAFLEDPRLRQRWNQITHDAEAVTENAAAGIWSFQHHYINPCFHSITDSFEHCTTVCLGDPEDRIRKRRERDRARGAAEYSFDFYDDWYEDEANGGLLGSWSNEDWDRLLAGTGSQRRPGGETSEQPSRKRGMSYGTRGGRRKTNEQDDPTVIPRTQPIGFLSKLPWKMGGTLRYKPSAADLQDHPGRHEDEAEPLLGDDDSDFERLPKTRKRSGTTGSGDTSDSYRSRGDLFPSDGEGEEDAVPLDDDVTYDMVRKDDRSSGRSLRTRSSKGKRPAGFAGSRTVSRTTLGSVPSRESLRVERKPASLSATPDPEDVPSLQDLQLEEQRLQEAEDEEVARKKEAAALLAAERGLASGSPRLDVAEPKPVVAEDEVYQPEPPTDTTTEHDKELSIANEPESPDQPNDPIVPQITRGRDSNGYPEDTKPPPETAIFIPARLPSFG